MPAGAATAASYHNYLLPLLFVLLPLLTLSDSSTSPPTSFTLTSPTTPVTATPSTRRVLHQPFFPVDSSPPPISSPPPSPSAVKYPFSSSAPDEYPFFSSGPSPPPPPPSPPSSSSLASFPANISSRTLPHSSSHRPVSPVLVAVTVFLSVSAFAVASTALFLYFRGRRRRCSTAASEEKSSASRSDVGRRSRPPELGNLPPRKQRSGSNTSSEFLYLGTLVNSRVDVGGSGAGNNGGNRRGGTLEPRKLDSPELHPLPSYGLQGPRHKHGGGEGYSGQQEDDEEEFYSPRGSASGGESSSLGAGSGSRRVFAAVASAAVGQVERVIQSAGGRMSKESSPPSSSASSESSSGTNSPARSASLSISPPVSASPESLIKAKSSPDIVIEMQNVASPPPTSHLAPPSPQLPPIFFSHASPPPPLIYSSPSPERDLGRRVKEEAEASPLLMTSPPESPSLSPLWAISGKDSRPAAAMAREWSVFDQNKHQSLPRASVGSSPSPKSSSLSSLKLPRFLGGRGGQSKKGSPESTRMSSPHSAASPVSSSSLSSDGDSLRKSTSPISNSSDCQNVRSYPASPSALINQKSSPELQRFSNVSDHTKQISGGFPPPAPPPPPPPPPPPLPPPRVTQSELPVNPVSVSEQAADDTTENGRTVGIESQSCGETVANNEAPMDRSESTPKPKLKPLHWDKVRASSDREMVWDQLRCSSFKLNEEMIETLFVVNNPPLKSKETTRKATQPSPMQGNRVLDPKKSQNIAISLRALNVTIEEVCEALLEGNAETLGTELLESLLKMAPTKEEEWKLKEYKDDSPFRLGQAERFLKAVIAIPFAFKRVEAMLYVANFESEVEYLKKSFETLELACDELRKSRMFMKLLEAVLKTGNRMNVGTNRGDAQAFKLDTLLKLVDVKGADGKTTLLHFVVQEIIRTEGARHSNLTATNNQITQMPPVAGNDDARCRNLGFWVISNLSSELTNVKKAAAMDSDALNSEVSKLSRGLANVTEVMRLNGTMMGSENEGPSRKFSESMEEFVRMAKEVIIRVQAQESVALSLVKEITEYFHGNSAKEEAHPFRIFMVVRDFLTILDRVCKEVGVINDRTTMTLAYRFPVSVNLTLPVPVNPTLLPQSVAGFRRQSTSDEEASS